MTGDWSAPAGTRVFVCENPTVLEAAADELGARCAPLVCTDGMPSLAALDLVAGLAAAGCKLGVRADIDEAGFVVVEQVRSAAPAAAAWRHDTATYARYLGHPDAGSPEGVLACEETQLRELRDMFERYRVPLHEEALLDQLLRDLAEEAGTGISDC